MKKILFILLALISLDAFCQHLKNADDSTTFKGAYVNFIALPRIGGNSLITDGIMDFDTVLRRYKPYSAKQTGIHFYDGVTNPDTTLRLNLNAKLYVGGLGCANTTTKYAMEMWNSGSGRMISGSNTSTGNFLFISNSSTGNAINGTNSSTGRFNSITNSSTGRAFYVAQSGAGQAFYAGVNSAGTGFYGYLGSCTGIGMLLTNVSTGATSGSYITLNRGQTGTNATSQDFILITDNPTTSGAITGGKILEVTEGSNVRLLLHPRVLNTGTPVAYNFGTYWNLTSGYLAQFNDSNVTKAYIDYAGNIGAYGMEYRDTALFSLSNHRPTGLGLYRAVGEAPTGTDTLFLNGYFRAKGIYGYEPSLGNPASSGYMLVSTSAGVRSWAVKFTTTNADKFTLSYSAPTLSLSWKTTKTLGAFYTENVNPSNTDTLNFDGQINATALSSEGGFMVKWTAGEALNRGECVYISQSDGKIYKTPTSNDMPVGFVYANALINNQVWIIVSGIAYVLPDTDESITQGYAITPSAEQSGRVDASSTRTTIMCGKALETSSGNGALTRAIIHFN